MKLASYEAQRLFRNPGITVCGGQPIPGSLVVQCSVRRSAERVGLIVSADADSVGIAWSGWVPFEGPPEAG